MILIICPDFIQRPVTVRRILKVLHQFLKVLKVWEVLRYLSKYSKKKVKS